jgi:hypothetical protein
MFYIKLNFINVSHAMHDISCLQLDKLALAVWMYFMLDKISHLSAVNVGDLCFFSNVNYINFTD